MRVGSWVDCDPNISHKNVKVKFFRKIDYPYPFCSLCLYEAQKKNGTLVQSPRPDNTSSWQKHSQVKASDDLL